MWRCELKSTEIMMAVEKMLGIWPPRPDICPICATDHQANEPHNPESLYYQMRFRQRNGVFPNWGDAMRHCPKDVQEAWKSRLREYGVAEEDLVAHRFYPESLDMEIAAEGKVTPEQREKLLRRPERPESKGQKDENEG